MIDLKQYYDFFGSHTFGVCSQIYFFQDGGFAIYDNEYIGKGIIYIYDKDCKLLQTFDEPDLVYILPACSVVVVKDISSLAKTGFKVYKNGVEVQFIPLEDAHTYSCFVTNGGASIFVHRTTVGSSHNSCFVLSSFNEEQFRLVKVDIDFSYYAIRLIQGDSFGNVAFNPYSNYIDKKAVIYVDAKAQHLLSDVANITFLADKRAIMRLKNALGTNLVSYEAPFCLETPDVLLHSQNYEGIKPLGDFAVIFEDALIAQCENGVLFSEYKEEALVSTGGTKVYPYVIQNKDGKGFYPNNKGKFFIVEEDILFVFFNNGMFHPLFIDLGLKHHECAILTAKNQYLSSRIAQAIP